MYLVDTSVWVAFLRGKPNPRVRFLEALLEEGEAHLCEVTFSEICFGAKNNRQLEEYLRHFSSLPFLALPQDWHQAAAKMGFQLRSKGFRPFIADLLIALTAITHRAALLTTDSDFGPYRELFGLEIQ